MSAPGEQYPASEGQGGDDGEASLDLGSFLDVVVPKIWLAVLAGAVCLLAFRMAVRKFGKGEDEQEVAQLAFGEFEGTELEKETDEEEEESEEEDSEEEGEAAGFSQRRLLDAETAYKLGYFSDDNTTLKPLSLLAKEARLCYYDSSDEELPESESEEEEEEEEEEDENEELEERLKKYL